MLKRIYNLFKGFFGLFVSKAEANNPKALLEVEKNNLREMMGEFNGSLAKSAGAVHKLDSEFKKSQKEAAAFKIKVQTYIKMGNNDMAGQFAAKLQKEVARSEQLEIQHNQLKGDYEKLVKSRDISLKAARDKIEQLADKIDDIATQKIMAEANEMAGGLMSNLSDNNLGHLEELIDGQLNLAKGRVTVSENKELMAELDFQEASQEVASEEALAAFMAAEGMTPAPAAEASPEAQQSSDTSMGPIAQ